MFSYCLHGNQVKVACIVFVLLHTTLFGQGQGVSDGLGLVEIMRMAAENSHHTDYAEQDVLLAKEQIKEAINRKMPDVGLHASYARMTNMMEYHQGISNATYYPVIPDMWDLTTQAYMPLFEGGRLRFGVQKARVEEEMATAQLGKARQDVKLEACTLYFLIAKLLYMENLLTENIHEEESRLAEVKSLQRNGVTMKDDIYRAELQLSDMQLMLMTNERNMEIAVHKLRTLLLYPAERPLQIDTTHILTTELYPRPYAYYLDAAMGRDEIHIANLQEKMAVIDKKTARSAYFPTVHFFGNYGYKYPNYMLFLFPPHANTYSLGMAGVDFSFSLSNLYKNRTRVKQASIEIEKKHIEYEMQEDEIKDEVFEQYTLLQDLLQRTEVNQKAILLAKENYRIVKAKYLNQLALPTEMIDADNALLQAKYTYISTKIDAARKYNELLYAAGLI